MRKSASVYNRKGTLFFLSSSQTTEGLWIENNSSTELDESATANQKGEAILKSLGESIQGIPHPTTWSHEDDDPFWKVAGTKSWATFVKGALYIDVELKNDQLTISPSKNEGAKEGFSPIPAKNIHLQSDASPDEIGIALDKALSMCE